MKIGKTKVLSFLKLRKVFCKVFPKVCLKGSEAKLSSRNSNGGHKNDIIQTKNMRHAGVKLVFIERYTDGVS